MANNNVTLTGTLPGAAGATAIFTPSGWLTDSVNHFVFAPLPVQVTLDGTGHFSVSLLATDNGAPQPAGWTWSAEFIGIASVDEFNFSFALPFAGGATQDISTLTPVQPVTAMAGYLPLAGGTLTGPLDINNVPSGVAGGLPLGRGLSITQTGIQVVSSYPSDDVNPSGVDGTGRINLYSYQRANASGFGETIRNFLMRWDAKANTAWYGPVSLYDGAGNAITAGGWTAWAWAGAHYEANAHDSIHGHYEIEVPDATGALQGRLIIPFADDDPASGTYGQVGLNKTNVRVNQADFTADSAWGVIRIGGSPGVNNRAIEWASSIYGRAAAKRWQAVANNTAEGGSNAGSDWQLLRYSDAGSLLGTAISVRRSDGQVTVGSLVTSGLAGGTYLRTPTSYAPGAQTIVSVSTATMAAFDSNNINTGSFVAPPSGSVMVTASFAMVQSASVGGAFGLAAHGTVTPMVASEWIVRDSAVTIPRPYIINFLVTGLTPGTSYNFDLMGAITAGNTMSLYALGVSGTSPTMTIGGSGAPVTMTVQAV